MFWGTQTRIFAFLVIALSASACGGADSAEAKAPTTAAQSIEQRIGGVWRLTNFIPDKDLEPSLLLTMQSEKIMLRFEEGTVRSVSSSLEFERRFRVADVSGDTFHLFVEEEGGIAYESICELDDLGTMSFESITEPWKGRGVLTREGTSLDPVN